MASTKTPSGLSGTNPSASDRVLYAHLENHIQAESGMEDLYDTLAGTGHPYITFLANLIGEDEARHHRLFQEWMESIKAMAVLDMSKGIPALDRAPVTAETIALVDRLLQFEKADLTAVKKLRKEIADMVDTTVWGALIETLIADTQKHIGILKFIKRHLRIAR
jgi:hypothetical protein